MISINFRCLKFLLRTCQQTGMPFSYFPGKYNLSRLEVQQSKRNTTLPQVGMVLTLWFLVNYLNPLEPHFPDLCGGDIKDFYAEISIFYKDKMS